MGLVCFWVTMPSSRPQTTSLVAHGMRITVKWGMSRVRDAVATTNTFTGLAERTWESTTSQLGAVCRQDVAASVPASNP